MGAKSRRKGARVELEILHLLQDAGIVSEKLSWAWKQTHDMHFKMMGRDNKMEIKSRARGFQQLYKWLEPVDVLVVKADRNRPLAVVSLVTLIELIKEKQMRRRSK